MIRRFQDRIEGGQLLARQLACYANRPDVIVLGLPRGGVMVAAEVARLLGAPLDLFLVRKLGAPINEELAIGAIASGGVRVLNGQIIERLGLTDDIIGAISAREQHELERRERAYRGHRPPLEVEGKIVILVDDGIATGATMHAAVDALRQQGPARIVVAAPTAAASTVEEFAGEADEVVVVSAPTEFYGVGQWYEDFRQTTDEEVCELLDRVNTPRAKAGSGRS